jgi:RimJ/RimL family protein N-acetyltransferase
MFETARLSAEPLLTHHFDEAYSLHQNAEVMATLGGLRDEETTRDFLDTNEAHWTRRGYGLWLIRDRETGEFAGRAGLNDLEIEGAPETEVAYSLMPNFWGRGLATELAHAFVKIGFETLALPEMIALTLTTNAKSRRVMEKAGFRYERDVVKMDMPHILCRLGADRYRGG